MGNVGKQLTFASRQDGRCQRHGRDPAVEILRSSFRRRLFLRNLETRRCHVVAPREGKILNCAEPNQLLPRGPVPLGLAPAGPFFF
jgi:hypothetical protein